MRSLRLPCRYAQSRKHQFILQKTFKNHLTIGESATIMVWSANADKSLLPARPGA